MEKASKIALMLAFAAISTFLVEPAYGTADDSPIKVLDPQSYPLVGGEWHVRFDVAGSGNLTVSAVNGTTMLVQDQQHAGRASHDLSFLRLMGPDGELVEPSGAGDGPVAFEGFSGSGTFAVMVHTPGEHHLGFEFGGAVAYASNNAAVAHVSSPDADGTYGAGDTINVTATFSEEVKVKFNPIKDGSVYGVLEGANYVDTVEIGGGTYALVTAFSDSGLQIVDITDPENPSPTASVTDGVGGFEELRGATSVDTAVIGGKTYALVAASDDDGLQIIDITDPENPSPTASVTDGVGGFEELRGAFSVDTAVIGGKTYALVAASDDDGLQIIDITDPEKPSPMKPVTDGVDGFEELRGARSVDTVEIGGSTYALVAAFGDDGLQIIDITDPENPSPTAHVTDGVGGFEGLGGARSVDTVVIGGSTYALVAASVDDGLQIIDITDPGNPSPTKSVTDGVGGFEGLGGARSVDTVEIGGSTYALVAASGYNGLQIIDITDPENPSPTASVTEGVDGFEELRGARSVDTVVIGGSTYALVAAFADSAVQVIDITNPASPRPILPYISLSLESGDGARALYSSGTGTNTLTFQYVVQNGDFSADLAYAGTDALASPDLAKILDNADEAETELALPMPGRPNSLSHNKDMVIDTAGSVTGVSSPDADGTYGTGDTINVTATFSEAVKVEFNPIKDGSVYGVLGDAASVATVVIGGSTYALVAAFGDDGLQIIDITDPGNPSPTASVTEGVGGFDELGSSTSVATVVIGGSTYALVAAFTDAGLQIIDITDPENPYPTASVTDGVDGFGELFGAISVDTAVIGGSTYALVAASADDGLQIIDITDPENPSPTASVTDGVDGFGELDGATSVDTVVIGGSTYALVAAELDDGLQIINITDPENPSPTASVTDGVGGFGELDGAISVDTAVIGGSTYALVAAFSDSGLQIINITDPASPSPTASVTDGVGGFEELRGAFSVDTAVIGGSTYALVAAFRDDGLQIINITDPENPSPTASVTEGVGGFGGLDGARSVDTAVIGGSTYALVAAFRDGSLQIIDITNPASPRPFRLPYISLSLESGDGARALYSSGTGTDTLTFQYVVRKGDFTADLAYAGTDALASPGLAKILDNADEAETKLALPMPGRPNSLSHNKDIMIDTGPLGSVTGVSSPDADGTYGAGDTINVTATFSEAVKIKLNPIKDGSVYGVLAGTTSVATVVIGGSTYALVAAFSDSGLQIIDITDPGNPSPTASVTDGVGGFDELGNSTSVATAVIGGSTYALVAAFSDSGLQIIDITDPGNPSPTASVTDGVGGFGELFGATSVATAVIGGSTYALVAAEFDDGLQIINITDPENPSPTASVTDGVGGFGGLFGAISVDTVVIGGSTYALVAASVDDGLQIIDITDPGNPSPTASVTDGVGGFGELDGARSVDTAVIGGSTYALVAASGDDGLQIINITDPGNPSPTASVTDGVGGFGELRGAFSVDTAVIGGSTYALVAAFSDSGLQIINITDPASPSPTASVTDGVGGFEDLSGAYTVTTMVNGNRTYALVSASADHAVQVIDITNPASPRPILPYISLSLASGHGARALYSSGTGTGTLTFQYVVREGDNSPDLAYAGTDALESPGLAKIRHNGGSSTVLALPAPGQPNSLSHNKDIVIDSVELRMLNATTTTPDSITVVLSEPVYGGTTDGAGWEIRGTGAGQIRVVVSTMPNGSDTIMLTLSAPLPSTGSDTEITYTYGDGGIADAAHTGLGGTVRVHDGVPPEILSVDATTQNTLSVEFTEHVTGNADGMRIANTTNTITINPIRIDGSSVILALDSDILGPDQPVFRYDPDTGNIRDGAALRLAGFNETIAASGIDHVPPVILNATVVGHRNIAPSIVVAFSEEVDTDTSTPTQWGVSGPDMRPDVGLSRVIVPHGGGSTMRLVFNDTSFRFPTTSPDIALEYVSPDDGESGRVWDAARNPLASHTVAVLDGLRPEYTGSDIVSSTRLLVNFTEAVSGGPGGFVVGNVPRGIDVVDATPIGNAIALDLSASILGSDAPWISYDQTTGNVADVAGNALGTFPSFTPLRTGLTPPTIASAVITAPDEISVTLSEPIYGDADASRWGIEGRHAEMQGVASVTIPEGGANNITIRLTGNLSSTAPDLNLTYNSTLNSIRDDLGNPMLDADVSVADGLAPTAVSARATSGTTVALTLSEPVLDNSPAPGDFTLGNVASPPAVSSITVSGDAVTLGLSAGLISGESYELSYARTSGSIRDAASNLLANFTGRSVDTSADIVPPTIASALAVTLDTITVTFDESVDADATGGSHWSLGGADAGALTVSGNTDPGDASRIMNLTLSGSLPDTEPALYLIYTRPDSGGVDDGANRLESANVTVSDGIAPTAGSVRATTSREIALVMSEPVTSGASGPGGFTVSAAGTAPTVLSIAASGSTVTLALSGPLPAGAVSLSYDRNAGDVKDAAATPNPLESFSARAVGTTGDIAPPAIASANATALNTITVTFDGNVDADAADGSHWSLGGADAGALTVSGNTDPGGAVGIMNLTLSGSLPDTAPELTLTYTRPDSGGVTDGTNQLESVTVNVDDGLAPTAVSARATSGTTVALTLSEPVLDNSPAPGDFTLGNVASPPAVSSITVSGDAVTLGLSAGLISGESYELSYARTSGSIRDAASNLLANFTGRSVDTSADIVPPTIASALAVTLDTITVTFDESVDADATGGSHWSLGGADAGALTVSGNTDPGDASRIMNLTLSGSLPDTEPALYLIYTRPDSGGVDDGANRLESANVTVSDGIAPTAGSVRATTSREIALVMSEPVTSGASGPGGFTVSAAGTAPTVLSIAASGSTVTLALSGPLPAGAVSLSYDRNAGDVKDAAATPNPLESFSARAVGTTGDIAPPAIASANATALNTITVTFDGNVDADAADGSHWSLGGADAGALTVSGNTDPGGAAGIMNLTLSGSLPDTAPELTLTYTRPDSGGVTDGTNQLESVTVNVDDGLAPTAVSARATSGTTVALTLSEPVLDNSPAPGDFTLGNVASPPAVSSITVSGDAVTLGLSAGLISGESYELSYARTSGSIRDAASNLLANFTGRSVDTSADIVPPTIASALAVTLDTITVTFDESVDADATGGSHWSLGGADAGALTVSGNTDPGDASRIMNLTLSGSLPDTEPALYLIYTRPDSGGVDDGANRLESANVTVSDGIAPTAGSVRATTSREIALVMSEPVTSGASGPGGFTVSAAGTAPTVLSIAASGSTVTLALSGPLPAGAVSLSYDRNAGDVKDAAATPNPLESFSARAVGTTGDIAPPAIASANATALNTITVTFDGNVDADAADGSHWSLGGADAGALTVSGNTDPGGAAGIMNLTLSGSLPDTAPELTLTYTRPDSGGVTDGVNQLESVTVNVDDGLAPTAVSARATSGTTVALTLSEPVLDNSPAPGDFTLGNVASPPAVSSITVSGDAVTLGLSAGLISGESYELSYARTSGSIRDAASNLLANFTGRSVDTSADIVPPTIASALAVTLDTITVTFDESVDADATGGSHWSLGGADAGALTVSGNTDPGDASRIMNLTLSGSLPDTEPALYLIYTRPDSGGVDDGANRLESANVTVSDGIAPTAGSVRATTSREIALVMSEPVTSGASGPGGFTVSAAGTAPTVLSIAASGSTVTLALSGPLPAGAVSLSYDRNAGDVKDAAATPNPLESFSARAVGTTGDIAPPAIASANATALNTITVTFDGNVDADAADGSHWSLGGADAGALTVSGNTDPGGAVGIMNLTLSGSLPDTAPELTLTYTRPDSGGVTDGTNQLESVTVNVDDGLAPTAVSARATSGTTVALTLSEPSGLV